MITVTVIGFDYALASAITGISDLLFLTGVSWNRLHYQEPSPKFKVQIASRDKKPISTLNNLSIMPHCSLEEAEGSDVYLIPTICGDVEKTLELNPDIIEALQQANNSSCFFGSNSNGSFFLAEAGLLDGKLATTHWGFETLFKTRYPKVNLKTEQLITIDDNVLCDGGGLAWFDLGLYLIELFCDHETAVGAAKTFVIDTDRPTQLSYSPLVSKKLHQDKTVLGVQYWIEEHFNSPISIDEISTQFGLSQRSLIRRFKAAARTTPSHYLQEVRLDAASKYLIQTNKTIEEITHAVGYEDISSFSKLFKRKTALSPTSYRARFKPIHMR